MNLNGHKYLFIKWSSEISPNVIDWIRSIYFSLLGSSMLTFSLKYSILSICSLLIFTTGILSFLFGLLMSVSIANRFKRYEINYNGLSESKKLSKKPSEYYYEQEIDLKAIFPRRAEHFFFYTLWIPALLCIGYAGFYMENKSTKSDYNTKDLLHKVDANVIQLDSQFLIINKTNINIKQIQDALNLANNDIAKRNKQIDSLRNVISKLMQRQTNKHNENKNK